MVLDFEDAQDRIDAHNLEIFLGKIVRAVEQGEKLKQLQLIDQHNRHWRTRLSVWLHKVANKISLK